MFYCQILFYASPLPSCQPYLNSSRMTEAGPLDEISEDEREEEHDLKLPGVKKGQWVGNSLSKTPLLIEVYIVRTCLFPYSYSCLKFLCLLYDRFCGLI